MGAIGLNNLGVIIDFAPYYNLKGNVQKLSDAHCGDNQQSICHLQNCRHRPTGRTLYSIIRSCSGVYPD